MAWTGMVSKISNIDKITQNRQTVWNEEVVLERNIARGTTDPEIDSETWTKLGNNMAPLALIANLAT